MQQTSNKILNATSNYSPSATKKKQDFEKDLFSNYEIIEITAMPMNFKGAKSALLSFSLQTEQQAQTQLLCMHTEMIAAYLSNFQEKLESLHKKMGSQGGELFEKIAEFIGSSRVATH